MTIAASIGCFSLRHFVRLNVAYLRRIFGDIPICLYDSPSDHNAEMRQVADDFACAYFCEPKNRGHFGGDIQASVCAVAFAQQHGCQIALKINQRTILLSNEIPSLLEREFQDERTTLVTPNRYPADSIIDPQSKFHSRFPQVVDVLAFRTSAWDAQGIADRYKESWTAGTDKYACYSEHFWHTESQRIQSAHRKVDWLTAHTVGEPFKYLRKIQNSQSDYQAAAQAIGLSGDFPTAEWSALRREYSPAPRA